MDRLCKPKLCTGCGACVSVCPTGCIRMTVDQEGFLQPSLDSAQCISCGRCQKACPVLADHKPVDGETVAYAAINTEEQVRSESTSGGVFALLCRWVLDRGGLVLGACYDDEFNVVHCGAENREDLAKFRGAKYAQSRLNDAYSLVQTGLQEGRYVLFSGTPCQVAGLVSFLGRAYEKLILVDLICHGVPSPKVWQYYIAYRSTRDAEGKKASLINLRSKETGWPGYSIRFDYEDGQFYSAPNSQDPYLRGFVGNLYLRPSCYHCRFKGSQRQSDVTLGDYWGVWSQLPDYHDGKGTSLVLLHSEKAKAIWDDLSANLRCSKVDLHQALAENPSALTPSAYSQTRDAFFARYQTEDFAALVEDLCPRPVVKKATFLQRASGKIRRILHG